MSGASDEVIVERVGSLARIRLNRPKALNSLTLGMVRRIAQALDGFETDPDISAVLVTGEGERGLCAGGDIRALYESGKAGDALAERFWREEYQLNARISHYGKPYIAVASGITMGGGVGLSAHAGHCIVSDTTCLAMPETGIGFFPDVGATWLLSRGSSAFGTYLGLAGEIVGAADAIHAGLAQYFVATEKLPGMIEMLAGLDSDAGDAGVAAAINRFASVASASSLAPHYGDIDRLFLGDKVEEILTALEVEGSDFATATAKTLRKKSPTSLVLTLALLRLGAQSQSLEECLEREFTASVAILSGTEFYEGIRAAVIDKDRKPRWSPERLSAVGGIERYLSHGARSGCFEVEKG